MPKRSAVALAVLGLIPACGGSSSSPDGAVPDGPIAIDAPGPDAVSITNLHIDEQKTLAGLTAPVDVVRDMRGVPHIYGQNIPDVLRVEGYLMARDRFPQMEFIRRGVLGRLSEVAGNVAKDFTLPIDEGARLAGYGREGRAIYATLADTDPTKIAAIAFTSGVNLYIDEVLNAADKTPFEPPQAKIDLDIIYNSPAFGHWDPADIFAFARYLSTSLSFDTSDIDTSRAMAGVAAKYGTDPSADRRAGAFVDMYGYWPARKVYTRNGFNQAPAKGAKQAPTRSAKLAPPPLPSIASLDGARKFLAAQNGFLGLVRKGLNGSNNWMVSGAHTASGHPILSNDPHLQLTSPAIWWYVHLNTKRAGGDLNAMGVAFAGAPGMILGYNDDLAWGATVTNYDVTDVYQEEITAGSPDTVTFNGAQVPVTIVNESIPVAGGEPVVVPVEIVPQHGYIIPSSKAGNQALSVKYTGADPSNELAYFYGLLTSKTVDDARAAQLNFKVGSQNFIVASKTEISWHTMARVPIRDDRALTLNVAADGTVTGVCPTMVLPGNGMYEWTGDIDPQALPNDRNPDKGYIVTANNDSVGVTDDGNPCNDPLYVGGRYDVGFREGRLDERLAALVARGNVTTDDMVALQAETQSALGRTMRTPMVESLARTIAAGATNGFSAGDIADLTLVHDRLAAWTLATPHGVGATDAGEIADSIATTIFNVGLTRIVPLAFADEAAAIGVGVDDERAAALIEAMLTNPSQLATYDSASGESVLWDDVSTPSVTETKDVIVGRGFVAALAFIRGRIGTDPTAWRWGILHTVIFKTVLPIFVGVDQLSIPPADDPMFPTGFPRHGDNGAPDADNFPLFTSGDPIVDFHYEHGPSQRLVVELLPDGPHPRNAMPGGQVFDPSSPHHRDEAEFWRVNQQPPMFYSEPDVVSHAEFRQRFTP